MVELQVDALNFKLCPKALKHMRMTQLSVIEFSKQALDYFRSGISIFEGAIGNLLRDASEKPSLENGGVIVKLTMVHVDLLSKVLDGAAYNFR